MEKDNKKRLLEFYGTECPHCVTMKPLIDRLERELNITLEKYEVWHNDENAKLMEQYDRGFCGGVPFFYNTATNNYICGSVPYEHFKAWAMEE
ncbi:MAG: hypothetical protein A3A80_03590 [Candidatus Terrybacteria bacterium RIFCSPLOWO2_01_FULL_44_24]|uniref:Thioredoxin domain-containing protein n=1 Tax=Candidatus Terrybacteria bacterium RIFCSPHIGHO2_01_FULL_43_35 TaxID=1802361 RepID=A0A1G2PDL1_9BACT|nr:MAG: hypothetical protein A2828_00510 [Candidatus Terrybacteria bacterium RIFCSPHIGHO2_01_FULL_43_35]OHA49765.1 MAG: hypothetical protein A3B75_02085 [Candidatus Terrybacteria bacterium RIFCSPHIGHO2_02_FULL_43_14]OHA51587.1 MAG: hypothetical protein A3A80_03590 [Candidatus Terrybacteria bacterium RIFCSPLOWO2_01_FULL_44_24]